MIRPLMNPARSLQNAPISTGSTAAGDEVVIVVGTEVDTGEARPDTNPTAVVEGTLSCIPNNPTLSNAGYVGDGGVVISFLDFLFIFLCLHCAAVRLTKPVFLLHMYIMLVLSYTMQNVLSTLTFRRVVHH